jgi:hypothetical protein
MFAKVSAIPFGILFLGVTHSATACKLSAAFQNRPKLDHILATHSTVFIGTVVDSGRPERKVMVGSPPHEVTMRLSTRERVMAKIKVEIPIRGEVVKIFEVPNGGGGDCSNGFEVGQRWFFSGTTLANSYFDGSTILVDEFGNVRSTGALGVAHEEIVRRFPDVLKLPSPSIVVRDYLKEK